MDSFKIICIDRNCKQNACIIYLYLNRFELVGIFLEGKIMHPAHLSILCFVLGTQSFLIQGNVLFEKYYLFNSNNKKWIWFFPQDIYVYNHCYFEYWYLVVFFVSQTQKWYNIENRKAILTLDKVLSKKKWKRINKWFFCKYLKLEIEIAYRMYFFNVMNQK